MSDAYDYFPDGFLPVARWVDGSVELTGNPHIEKFVGICNRAGVHFSRLLYSPEQSRFKLICTYTTDYGTRRIFETPFHKEIVEREGFEDAATKMLIQTIEFFERDNA